MTKMNHKIEDNPPNNIILNIDKLTVYYQHVRALSEVSLRVQQGEYLGIIGPNGGGKSTLLRAILGLIKPHSGKIEIFGLPQNKALGKIGYVPQFTKFYRDFPISLKDTVLMGRLRGKIPIFYRYTKDDIDRADSLMEKLELYPLRNRQIGQLSGGQIQRTLIARALITEPEILLLDEPTASLDTESKSHIYTILEELNKAMTIIMVTHDMSAISSHVHSLACLNENLYYHGDSELSDDVINDLYGCPVDLIAHGIPHRVLRTHR